MKSSTVTFQKQTPRWVFSLCQPPAACTDLLSGKGEKCTAPCLISPPPNPAALMLQSHRPGRSLLCIHIQLHLWLTSEHEVLWFVFFFQVMIFLFFTFCLSFSALLLSLMTGFFSPFILNRGISWSQFFMQRGEIKTSDLWDPERSSVFILVHLHAGGGAERLEALLEQMTSDLCFIHHYLQDRLTHL